MTNQGSLVLSPQEVEICFQSLARQIWDKHQQTRLALIGIRKGGVPMMQRVSALLREMGADIRCGILDITFHRDDLHNLDAMLDLGRTDIDIPDIAERCVILLDDVLFTGRTIRAALNEILDFGRPRRVELAVLIDRNGRELPIQADYACHTLQVKAGEYVRVILASPDRYDGVWIEQKTPVPQPQP